MKKIFNILIFTIVLTISSLIFSTVKAEKIRFYYECTFVPSSNDTSLIDYYLTAPWDSSVVTTRHIAGNALPREQRFYFTDLKEDEYTPVPLLANMGNTGIIEIWGILDSDNDKETKNSLHNSFDSISKQTRACPKYLEFINTGRTRHEDGIDGEDGDIEYIYYEQKFTNELSGNAANYMVLDETKSETIDIYEENTKWVRVFNGKDLCSNVRTEFKIRDRLIYLDYWKFGSDGNPVSDVARDINVRFLRPTGGIAGDNTGRGRGIYSMFFSDFYNFTHGKIDEIRFSVRLSFDGKNKFGYTPYGDGETRGQKKNWCWLNSNEHSFSSQETTCTSSFPETKSAIESFLTYTWQPYYQDLQNDDSIYKWSRKGQDTMPCDEIGKYIDYSESTLLRVNNLGENRNTLIHNKAYDLLNRLKNVNKDCPADSEQYADEISAYESQLEGIIANSKKYHERIEETTEKLRVINNTTCKDQELAKKIAEVQEHIAKVKEEMNEVEKIYKAKWIVDADYTLASGCDLIGYELKKFLNSILWYVRLIAIVLAVILSLTDYIKAAAGSDDKPMAAANKKFMTRLILIIVLFLLPVLLQTVLNIVNVNGVSGASIDCLK